MTAIRMPRRLPLILTAAVLVALWAWAAVVLWRTSVPGGLHVPTVDPHALYAAATLGRARHFGWFLDLLWLLGTIAQLAALLVLVWRAPRLARQIGLGRIGTGVIVGMLTLTVVWAVSVPFTVLELWWERRYGLSEAGYVAWLVQPWAQLLGEAVAVLVTVVVVMALAGWLPRLWWIPATAVYVGVAALFTFASPYLLAPSTHPVGDPVLRADIRALQEREHVTNVPVVVDDVSTRTSVANAYQAGLGPTRRVVLWDTLLGGRFSRGEVNVVVAHELGHAARSHLPKELGWFALLAVPTSLAIALATRRRGGMGDPGNIPLGLLVAVLASLVLLPLSNAVSRRYEAEADWSALQATRDPSSAELLFRRFAATDLADPSPPTLAYVFREDHPTLVQRIALARAWRSWARNGGR